MNHAKSEREIGVSFRPFDETLADVVAWYRRHGELPICASAGQAFSLTILLTPPTAAPPKFTKRHPNFSPLPGFM